MVIRQGDVFWIDFGQPQGSSPAYRHPGVVVQNNIFNRSSISTTVVCVITSNLDRLKSTGNVLLSKGEANLTKKCVTNISQIFTIDKNNLKIKIGSLNTIKIHEIIEGLSLLLHPRDIDES